MKRQIYSFLALSFLMLGLTGCGAEVDPRTIWYDRLGAKELQKGSVSDSQRSFLEALKINPFIGELHVNLGLTYQALKQGDAAIESYQSAERWARNKNVLFISRFDQGVLRGENKQVDLALDDYQRALEVRPDSKEVKTNIELLMQSQSGQGKGESKDQDKKGKEGQDQKKNQDQKNQDQQKKDKQDQQDQDQKKQYSQDKPYKPREFKGDLSEQDVKKILGELKQQEQKIRSQFYRGDAKEKPHGKDW